MVRRSVEVCKGTCGFCGVKLYTSGIYSGRLCLLLRMSVLVAQCDILCTVGSLCVAALAMRLAKQKDGYIDLLVSRCPGRCISELELWVVLIGG